MFTHKCPLNKWRFTIDCVTAVWISPVDILSLIQLNIRLNPATQLPCERSTQPSKQSRYDMAFLELKAFL